MDTKEEAEFRCKLAERYVEEARKHLKNKEIVDTVRKAQLSVENGVKAIIACFKLPSWSHDPSRELLEVLSENRDKIEKIGVTFPERIKESAKVASELAPEHGRTNYGEPITRKTPWELYDKEYAKRVLEGAEEVVKAAREFVGLWFL